MLTREAKKSACSFAKEGEKGKMGGLELDKEARFYISLRTTCTASYCGYTCLLLSCLNLRAVWSVLCTAMY